jgi:hypothetical protein
MLTRADSIKTCRVALAVLLVIAISTLLAHYCDNGTGGPSRLEAIWKFPSKSLEGVRQKATHRLALAVRRANVNLNFVSYSFIRRLDFKQNLRVWPVLSNDLERSPPFLAGL